MKNEVLNEIFANVPNIAGKTREESIYCKEIYKDCELPTERKKIRTQLRKNRDKFLTAFLVDTKKGQDLKALQNLSEMWFKYANQVYKDAKMICENNTNEETKKLCFNFVNAMETAKSNK